MTGRTVLHYQIGEKLGEGGMGAVYKAIDSRLGRTVAIKMLHGGQSGRFETEARAIAALNHPHICALYDIGSDYLVMEYVEGAPLKGPLAPEEALRLALQIASALEEAHAKGIIHRDLKPPNILVTKSGVKLLDFGLAKIGQTEDSASEGTVTKTHAGTILGTAAYMSPEQAEGRTVDARSDIFSFGLVLYEMLSGRRAFVGENAISTMAAILHKDAQPLQAPAALEQIVMRCLEKQPADRFQTMSEVRTALEGAGRGIVVQHRQPSIAVLPFADMSPGKDNEYFSDGLAEEIINALTHVSGLKVIARTSAFAFKGKPEDIRKIAAALGVANVLEGSVRKAGNQVRISAQLITAADGSHLWSERYDRDMTDVFAVQDEISQAIAAALQLKLSTKPAARGVHKPNVAAYEVYLQGRHHYFKITPEGFARAKECYERAIALDPDYAIGHLAQGLHYWGLALSGQAPARDVIPLARIAVEKALQIDPGISEAHAILGSLITAADYDWKTPEQHFRRAMSIEPVPADARALRAMYHLAPLGRAQEALEEWERVVEQDPLNLLYRSNRALAMEQFGRGDEAVAELHKALEIDDFWFAHTVLGIHYAGAGMNQEALAEAEKAYHLAPWNLRVAAMMAGLAFRAGDRARAEDLIARVRATPGKDHWIASSMAIYYCLCSDGDAAAEWLEKAIEYRDPSLLTYWRLPLLAPLRSSTHWPRLRKMMNLPETL